MNNSKLMKSIVALLAIAALAVPGVSYAQDSKLFEREERLIYSRAFEAIMWGSPALAVYAQHEAGQRDLGGHHLDIIYTGEPMDHRWGSITYNNQSPYFVNHFSLKDGPVVVEIPPASPEARVFGSIHDVWQIRLRTLPGGRG